MVLSQLARPFCYYLIEQPQKKIVDWVIPAALALISAVFFTWTAGVVNFFGPGGVVAMTLGLIQSLPGFYIAALAAIATFGRTDIDELMPGNPPPTVKTRSSVGNYNSIALTRRRFLCLLFAFLTVECLLIAMAFILTVSFAAPLAKLFSPAIYLSIRFVTLFVLSLFLAQMLTATLWGLYYLGDRIHLSTR